MLKILQINSVINSGSTGRIAEEIGKTILKQGQDSYIAYSRSGQSSSSISLKIGTKFDFYSHVLQTRIFDNHGFASRSATSRLIKKIKAIGPDIIHLHNIHGYYINIEILFNFILLNNKPVVWTFHDCWPFTGHCSYFDRFECAKWKTKCSNCPMKRYYPTSWWIDNSENNYERKKYLFTTTKNLTIVTPSIWLKNLVGQSFLKEKPIVVIPNGIDLSVFKPRSSDIKRRLDIENHQVILGVASIWDKRKGLDDFIAISKMIPSKFKIVLVGLTEKQIQVLPENILGISRTESTIQVAELYSSAEVFVNPTYSDNFPTTNIEALACGTPVITYDTGGSPEAIDEKTGIVIKKGNLNSLKEAINKILTLKENYSEENCRNRAENFFGKEKNFQKYFNLYKDIIIN